MSFFYRATMHWRNTVKGLSAQNQLWFEDPSDLLNFDQIGSIIDNEWWGELETDEYIRQYTCDAVVLQMITLAKVFPLPASGSVPYVTAQRPGHQGGPVKHPALGFLFTLRDGLAGKRHRGRVYHYGAVPGHLFDEGPNPALMVPLALPSVCDRWMQQFGPLPISGLHWCLFHRGQAGAAQFTRITQVQVSQVCAVQRRRRVGIGI